MTADLLQDLNDAQREAVLHGDGPLLVLAGAGSGKTRVIVHRIARLVRDEGVVPWQVLAVTFTNKAAGEMKERLERLLGPAAQELWVQTFHAFGARFLRREAARAGLPPSFAIYDTDDQLRLVKRIFGELRIDDSQLSARDALSYVDGWKNDALLPAEVPANDWDRKAAQAREVYGAYQKALTRAGAVDFGDLLLLPARLLEQDRQLRARWAGRFRHILVDEFQDTNRAQYKLLQLLCGPRRNVCVVGDDDQAIYRWRGADVRNILGFEEAFPGARVVKLEQNYRSTKTILDAAHAVISRARHRREKRLWTEADAGTPLSLMIGEDESTEAERIARMVADARARGVAGEEIAVLYRTNAQSRPVEAAMRAARIPYVIVRGTSFYERAEVKDAAAYLRLALNPRSDLDVLRVVNRPSRKIGDKTVERLSAFAAQSGSSLYEALADPDAIPELKPAARASLAGFRDLVASLAKDAPGLDAGIAVQEVLSRTGMLARLEEEHTDEAVERAENLAELVEAAREFDESLLGEGPPTDPDEVRPPPLQRFLEQIALLGDADAETPEGRVALMTLHAAKGLEFEVVFLSGLEEATLPYRRPGSRGQDQDPDDLDEERRLCYVGMTRAKRQLVLSLARRRIGYTDGGVAYRQMEPSRFLGDLPPDLFGSDVARQVRAREAQAAPQARAPIVRRHPGALDGEPHIELDGDDGFREGASPAPRAAAARGEHRVEYELDQTVEVGGVLRPGTRVTHDKFGEGLVLACDRGGKDAKATVRFASGDLRVVIRFLRPA